MLQKVEGIVLRARDYGESHQVILIFSEYQGKIAVMARGSKKPKSRFGAVTEPFTEAHFVYFTGGSGMPTLSQADLIHSHHLIRSDLLLTAYGAYWLDLIDKCTEEKEPCPGLYRFLTLALKKLESGTDPDILTRMVELRIMRIAGYQPVLHHCANCRQQHRPVRFSIRQGGFLCADCQNQDPESLPLTEATARILPLLERIPLEQLGEVKVKPETKEQLERIVHAFMEEYFPFKLKSLTLLKQIRQSWGSSS
ncbi:DNA repair protein RecO [Lihuaxuella thermophila]|uniref:DNA repair protein RecO n=1 Tax=Lihuaxuella thermophila TaxID=1173111 RepID=A0A1H8DBP1_9BACL|nr:DNA repair protein RecO [Lihuaxuella thermophila]SEN04693.1 DNA replication and repair protein RecO [Lihuaxuella thermophila]